jgi:hypothetical protein
MHQAIPFHKPNEKSKEWVDDGPSYSSNQIHSKCGEEESEVGGIRDLFVCVMNKEGQGSILQGVLYFCTLDLVEVITSRGGALSVTVDLCGRKRLRWDGNMNGSHVSGTKSSHKTECRLPNRYQLFHLQIFMTRSLQNCLPLIESLVAGPVNSKK